MVDGDTLDTLGPTGWELVRGNRLAFAALITGGVLAAAFIAWPRTAQQRPGRAKARTACREFQAFIRRGEAGAVDVDSDCARTYSRMARHLDDAARLDRRYEQWREHLAVLERRDGSDRFGEAVMFFFTRCGPPP